MSNPPPPPSSSSNSSSPFKSNCLEGKVALITGGGSGIGYEITCQLLLHGCAGATICGRRESFLQSASRTLSSQTHKPVHYQVCDVRNPNDCKNAIESCVQTFGKLDILINAAAGNFLVEASALKPKGFQTVMEIDTMGTYNMCHYAHKHLKRSSSSAETSSIINISATLQYGATWYQSHASAAKSAVDSLTRSLALEWGIHNIRVNGIAPGPIENTPGTTKLAPGISGDDVAEMVQEGIPLGRMGRSFDIGMAAVFLACDASASFLTGDVLVVDGAQWMYKTPMVPRDMVAQLSRQVESKSRKQAPPGVQSKL